MTSIYGITLNGKIMYIGCTKQSLKHRWTQHKSRTRLNIHNCPLLDAAIAQHGEAAFDIVMLETTDDHEHALTVLEPHYIQLHQTHSSQGGFNVTTGGRGTSGWQRGPMSDAHKAAISRARKGQKGHSPSPEVRERMRQSMISFWARIKNENKGE